MTFARVEDPRAYVELLVKGDLKGALNKAAADVKAFGQSLIAAGATLGAAGASVSAPLMFAIHEFRGAAGELLDLATVTGVNAQRLSEMQQAAIRLGGSAQQVSTGIQSVGRFMAEVAQGGPGAIQAMALLGENFADLKKLSPDEQFMRLSAAIAKLPNVFQRASVAQQILGDGSGQMLRLIEQNADAWRRATDAARASGQVMSTQDVAAARELNTAWHTMTAAVNALWQKIGAALAPSFTVLLNLLTDGIGWVARWIDRNRALVRIVDITATALTVVGAALTGVYGVSLVVSGVLGGLATIVGAVGSAITFVGGAVVSLVTGFVTFAAALIPMLPIIALVGAGLALLAAQSLAMAAIAATAGLVIYHFWDRITDAVGAAMRAIRRISVTTWKIIVDDIRGAWALIKNVVSDNLSIIIDATRAAGRLIGIAFEGLQMFARAAFGVISTVAGSTWGYLTNGFAVATRGAGKAFARMGETITETWGTVQASLAEGNLTDAFGVGVAGVKLLWVQVTNFLREKWTETTNWLADAFEDAFARVSATLRGVWARLTAIVQGAIVMMRRELHLITAEEATKRLGEIRKTRDQTQQEIGNELEAATNPDRESNRRRQEGLAGIRAEDAERERAAREELDSTREMAEWWALISRVNRENAAARIGTPSGGVIAPLGGTRGTFSGAALAGLAGAGGNPVVDAIHEQTARLTDALTSIDAIRDQLARGLGIAAG